MCCLLSPSHWVTCLWMRKAGKTLHSYLTTAGMLGGDREKREFTVQGRLVMEEGGRRKSEGGGWQCVCVKWPGSPLFHHQKGHGLPPLTTITHTLCHVSGVDGMVWGSGLAVRQGEEWSAICHCSLPPPLPVLSLQGSEGIRCSSSD